VTGVASSASSPSFLTKTLRLTNQSREIIVLQTFLSKDKDVYPSGLITGYFGQATKKSSSGISDKVFNCKTRRGWVWYCWSEN
jgi:hypothetical protein